MRDASAGPCPLSYMIASSRSAVGICVIPAVALGFLSNLSLLVRVDYVNQAFDAGLLLGHVTMGDALLWAFLGNPVGLAPEWAAFCVLALAGSALGGLRPIPPALVASGSRTRCWLACCAAAVLRSVTIFVALACGVAVWACALGCAPILEAPTAIGWLSLGVAREGAGTCDVVSFLLLTAIGLASVSLAQLALGFVMGELAALCACAALVLGSAFAPLLPLPGSMLMVSRLLPFAVPGQSMAAVWPMWVGFLVFCALGACAVAVGGTVFTHRDLFSGSHA